VSPSVATEKPTLSLANAPVAVILAICSGVVPAALTEPVIPASSNEAQPPAIARRAIVVRMISTNSQVVLIAANRGGTSSVILAGFFHPNAENPAPYVRFGCLLEPGSRTEPGDSELRYRTRHRPLLRCRSPPLCALNAR
jgi:hypothetical protein